MAKQKDLTGLINFRARQLAYLVLTRRDDLTMTQGQRLGGFEIDLAATVLERGRESGRMLAVQVRGVRWNADLPAAAAATFSLSDIPFPVAEFIFSMEDDEGYWRWLIEPVEGSGAPADSVQLAEATSLEPVTDAAVLEIVERVRRWYEARRRAGEKGRDLAGVV